MSEFDRLQEMAIPPASENNAGEKYGNPGTPSTSRDRLLKKASLPGGDVNMLEKGAPSPHAAPINREQLAAMTQHPDDADPVDPNAFNAKRDGTPAELPNFDPTNPFETHEAPAPVRFDKLATPAYKPGAPDYPDAREAFAPRPAPVVDPRLKALQSYLANKMTVTAELESGTFMLPAIHVSETALAVTVLMPLGGVSFIPKAGTELTLSFKDRSWLCFYPGTYASYEELGFNVLCFVKADA